jgi:DNA repair protein RadC
MPYKQIEVKISYKGRNKESPTIESTNHAAQVARVIANHNSTLWREEAFIMCLNQSNRLLGWHQIAIGGIDFINIDNRIICAIALKCLVTQVILIHNHPGGSPKPSQQDIQATNKLKQVLEFHDLSLLDHIILTEKNHLSMKDQGII